MNKYILVIVSLVIIGFLGHALWKSRVPIPATSTTNQTAVLEKSGTYCYEYHQVATPTAPYKVDENIKINIMGTNVTGTKDGTQAGPDMTNGYHGSLTGTIDQNNLMTVVFDYIVEGSHNKEQEEYKITPSALIKQRYPLVEKNKILVPDKTGSLQEITYNKVECK